MDTPFVIFEAWMHHQEWNANVRRYIGVAWLQCQHHLVSYYIIHCTIDCHVHHSGGPGGRCRNRGDKVDKWQKQTNQGSAKKLGQTVTLTEIINKCKEERQESSQRQKCKVKRATQGHETEFLQSSVSELNSWQVSFYIWTGAVTGCFFRSHSLC